MDRATAQQRTWSSAHLLNRAPDQRRCPSGAPM